MSLEKVWLHIDNHSVAVDGIIEFIQLCLINFS